MLDTYTLIIGISAVLIISFFFNIAAKKTNIPSVLMLIALGVIIKEFIPEKRFDADEIAKLSTLEIIGNIGLVMIVLEAALDLKLSKEKSGLILNSFLVAFIGLVASTAGIATLIFYVVPGANESLFNCIVYAVPLAIMSSAIIIPSVAGLTGYKKEFMVYESTFSDILGIMVFFFLMEYHGFETKDVVIGIGLNIIVTVIVSIILAYVLVFIFQRLTSQVKLFLVIAVLMLMYALGKKFHLSSLLIILAFGLVLNNTKTFFSGNRLGKLVNEEKVKPILHDFHILTLESAFVVRTFFFVIFGMFITLSSIVSWNVAIVSVGILFILYLVRFITLKAILKRDISPQLYIAPRGLITILLFFQISGGSHDNFTIHNFDPGILLLVVLVSSIVMTIALITYRGDKVRDVLFSQIPKLKKENDEDGDGINDNFQNDVEDNVERQDFNQF